MTPISAQTEQPTPAPAQWRVPLVVLVVDEGRREDPALLEALNRVLEQLPEGIEAVTPPERSSHDLGMGPRSGLTRAEDAVLALLPSGMTNAEIAERLFVSVNTVKTHLRRVFAKLGVRNRREAVRRAVEMGLVEFGSTEPTVWSPR